MSTAIGIDPEYQTRPKYTSLTSTRQLAPRRAAALDALWPLNAVLWIALVVIAFCGITVIVFNASAPRAGPASASAEDGSPPGDQWPGRIWRSALRVVPRRRRTRARSVLVFW